MWGILFLLGRKPWIDKHILAIGPAPQTRNILVSFKKVFRAS